MRMILALLLLISAGLPLTVVAEVRIALVGDISIIGQQNQRQIGPVGDDQHGKQ